MIYLTKRAEGEEEEHTGKNHVVCLIGANTKFLQRGKYCGQANTRC
jgi:hypothetical protein